MLAAHDAFLAAWGEGHVLLPRAAPRGGRHRGGRVGARRPGSSRSSMTASGTRPREEFVDEYGAAVAEDRDRLVRIRDALAELDPGVGPEAARCCARCSRTSPAEKVAVFATYAATVRYLDEHLPDGIGGRERIAVDRHRDDARRAACRARGASRRGRWCARTTSLAMERSTSCSPPTCSRRDRTSSRRRRSLSYDMPWNPQRVVQRNGRVIRLLSEHEEVLLTTMLPEPGELDALLGLEARIQGKIKAAGGVYGMELGGDRGARGRASQLR